MPEDNTHESPDWRDLEPDLQAHEDRAREIRLLLSSGKSPKQVLAVLVKTGMAPKDGAALLDAVMRAQQEQRQRAQQESGIPLPDLLRDTFGSDEGMPQSLPVDQSLDRRRNRRERLKRRKKSAEEVDFPNPVFEQQETYAQMLVRQSQREGRRTRRIVLFLLLPVVVVLGVVLGPFLYQILAGK